MSFKEFDLDDLKIKVIKNKKNRRIRLTISNNEIKVSIPYFIPYIQGIKFAESKKEWIKTKLKPKPIYTNNQKIGKNHHLKLIPANQTKPSSRIDDISILLKYPNELDPNHPEIQNYIEKKVYSALKKQALTLIPKRVNYLAQKHGYQYKDISIKLLKTKWGSCDSQKNLTFNLKLMNLEWELIDYVILHELAHTKFMNHQQAFWDELTSKVSNTKILRAKLKTY